MVKKIAAYGLDAYRKLDNVSGETFDAYFNGDNIGKVGTFWCSFIVRVQDVSAWVVKIGFNDKTTSSGSDVQIMLMNQKNGEFHPAMLY